MHPDAMGDVKLAGPTLARPTPRVQQPAVGRELVHPAVGVAVRNEQVAVGRQRDVGGNGYWIELGGTLGTINHLHNWVTCGHIPSTFCEGFMKRITRFKRFDLSSEWQITA